MKQKQFLFTASLLIATASVFAQKKLTEGTISYDVVITTTSDKPKSAGYLDGTTVATYIKGSQLRTETISSVGTLTTIHHPNNSKDSVVILKEFGDQKYMITLSPADWTDANRKYQNLNFSLDNSAAKNVLGYNCKKATTTLQDGSTYTAWYTSDLLIDNKAFQYETRSLPGVVMQYDIDSKDQKVSYTVSKISFSPVPAAKFDLPKAGFRVLTYAESKRGN